VTTCAPRGPGFPPFAWPHVAWTMASTVVLHVLARTTVRMVPPHGVHSILYVSRALTCAMLHHNLVGETMRSKI
jgi:hypothetical protein